MIRQLHEFTYIKKFKIISKKVKYKKSFKTKNKIAIIKIDVEGYEHICLDCLKKIIIRDKPILFIEFNKENNQLVSKFIKKNKYKCYFYDKNRKKIISVSNPENFNNQINRKKEL